MTELFCVQDFQAITRWRFQSVLLAVAFEPATGVLFVWRRAETGEHLREIARGLALPVQGIRFAHEDDAVVHRQAVAVEVAVDFGLAAEFDAARGVMFPEPCRK